jgi:hypothetical protein
MPSIVGIALAYTPGLTILAKIRTNSVQFARQCHHLLDSLGRLLLCSVLVKQHSLRVPFSLKYTSAERGDNLSDTQPFKLFTQSCKFAVPSRISSQTKMLPNPISIICPRPLGRIDNVALKRWGLFTVE